MRNTDKVLPFYLTGEEGNTPRIRGRIARLHHASNAILSRHDYPDIVAGLCCRDNGFDVYIGKHDVV